MKTLLTFSLFLILMLSGCSWVEYFTICNNTSENIDISYSININTAGFKIFDVQPRIFSLKKANIIDWDKQLDITDQDTTKHIVHITLPPNSSVIIGELHNDSYEKNDQKFINGRIFNLQELTIKEIKITLSNFDSYFTKKKGLINCPLPILD
jgi:hypothetical protein